jgi:hypothetical protein
MQGDEADWHTLVGQVRAADTRAEREWVDHIYPPIDSILLVRKFRRDWTFADLCDTASAEP